MAGDLWARTKEEPEAIARARRSGGQRLAHREVFVLDLPLAESSGAA